MTRVKKEAGSTEQNDAEYARNLAILRLLTQQQKTVNNSNSTSSSATDSTSTANPLVLPADQVQQLKYQIMAFQHLARNKPMPPHLASAAISPEVC